MSMIGVFVSNSRVAAACACLLLIGCDLGRPPKPSRPSTVPEAAELEFVNKVGWVWSLCIDTKTGSADFHWSSAVASPEPYLRIHPVTCSASELEARDTLEMEGGANSVAFYFPEAEDRSTDQAGDQPCPLDVPSESFDGIISTLSEALRSDKLNSEARAEGREMRSHLETLDLSQLRLSGGRGNTAAWQVRCS